MHYLRADERRLAKIVARRTILAAVAALLCLLATAMFSDAASADIYLAGYGGTTDLHTGAHGDLTVGATFTYSVATDDLKRVVVDTPAGGVGNPNAVPYADRCTKADFETGTCPAASQIGVVELDVIATWLIFDVPLSLTGTISIIQTDPEVPTTVGAYIAPPIGSPVRSYATFYPVTGGPDDDFRIRSVTSDFPRTTDTGILGVLPIRVTRYEQTLWGKLPSGEPFITNPTRCETWMSYGYAEAYDANTNADSDPLLAGLNQFVRSAEVPTAPDCSVTPPFPVRASATVSSGKRGESPSLTTTLETPGVDQGDPSPDAPKTVVATLPKSINADIMKTGDRCSLTDLAADTCPAASKVGTVRVETPMIKAGLSGDAYLTDPAGGSSLPDLVLRVRGAIEFDVRGVNRYVNGSQLQSTYDDLPQPGFTKFELTLNGGGILKNISCPKDEKVPEDGPFSFSITGYTGQTYASETPLSYEGCYGITAVKFTKCAKQTLRVKAFYRSRNNLKAVRMYINGRRTILQTREPFAFKKNVRPFHRGRKRLTLLAFYKDGTIVRKTVYFKRC